MNTILGRNFGWLKGFIKTKTFDAIATWFVVLGLAFVVSVLPFILGHQDVKRNIALQATEYHYGVGQSVYCQTDEGWNLLLPNSAGDTWVKCKIVSKTPDGRYYKASFAINSTNQYKPSSTTVVKTFSVQNVGVKR